MADEWLSLREAADLLGVHPGTVRIWSDKGLLPVYRTKGGHRRYKVSEVQLWAKSARGQPTIEPASVVQAAMRNIRMHISEGHLEAEGWYRKLDGEARAQYRESARTLFQGLVNYLVSGGDDGKSEAHSIGYEYASRARRFGLDSVDAARAFLFFRDALLESVLQVYREANVPSGNAWGDILHAVNAFTDLILLNLLETYQAMEKGGGS
jgi:excisionase family DNA binding protein